MTDTTNSNDTPTNEVSYTIHTYAPDLAARFPGNDDLFLNTDWDAKGEAEQFVLRDIEENFTITHFNPQKDTISLRHDTLTTDDISISATDDGLLYSWEGGSLLLKGLSDSSNIDLDIYRPQDYHLSKAEDETLEGGQREDFFDFEVGHGNDTIVNFDIEKDILRLERTKTDFTDVASVLQHSTETSIDGEAGVLINTGGNDSIFLQGMSLGDLASIDLLLGDTDKTNLTPAKKSAEPSGTSDDDILVGEDGADTFVFKAGHGHDTIQNFNFTADTLDLSTTEVDFTSAEGVLHNSLEVTKDGEEGVLISTGTEDSVFLEGANLGQIRNMNLSLETQEAGDNLNGGNDDDTIGASDGDDTVSAGGGDDIVYGRSGNDLISGDQGDDILFGGTGSDSVQGGHGNDQIYGGTGHDSLSGGAGADTFYFKAGHGSDKITDFDVDADTLHLTNTAVDFTDIDSVMENTIEAKIDGVPVLLISTGADEGILLEGMTMADLSSMNLVL